MSYPPWGGGQWVNFWIPFSDVPRSRGLEVVRGSHRGTLYDGTLFDAQDPTLPLWGVAGDLPRLPDIEKQRKADRDAWDTAFYRNRPAR